MNFVVSSTRPRTGRAQFAPLEIVVRGFPAEVVDLSSLMASGQALQGVDLEVFAAGQPTTGAALLALTLDGLIFTRVDAMVGARDDAQRVQAMFTKTTWTHTDPATRIVTTAWWDAFANNGG